jgi:hypothetical protein
VIFAVLAVATQAFAQGVQAGSTVTTLHFGTEVWLAIISVLVSIGVSIEQLRRARMDIREGVGKIALLDRKIDSTAAALESRFTRLPDEFVRRDFWMARMQSIEDEQKNTRSATERIERRIDTLLISSKP